MGTWCSVSKYVRCGLYSRVHLHMVPIDTDKPKVRALNIGIPLKLSPEPELDQTLPLLSELLSSS
jgi:hypothetical protein